MIYARSPYIVHIDDSGLERAVFSLAVYRGDRTTGNSTDPDAVFYEFDITAIDGVITFDIAPYIRDRINTFLATSGISSDRFVWVRTDVRKDVGAGLPGTATTYEATQLACYGYTLPGEGVNYTTYTQYDLEFESSGIRNMGIITSAAAYPSFLDTPDGGFGYELTNWVVAANNTAMGFLLFTDDLNNGAITIREYDVYGGFPQSNPPATETNTILNMGSTSLENSFGQAKRFEIGPTTKSFSVFVGSVDVQTTNVHRIGDCRNDVKRIVFINKFGAPEELHFVGRSVESYSTQSREYRSNMLRQSTGTYSLYERQVTTYNKNAKRRLRLNSGPYPEGYNEQFKQLLMSEKVWIKEEEGASETTWRAVKILNSDLEYKYNRYEKAISYDIEIEYATDAINSIK